MKLKYYKRSAVIFVSRIYHLRRHGGLNYETPFDKLQKVTELVS